MRKALHLPLLLLSLVACAGTSTPDTSADGGLPLVADMQIGLSATGSEGFVEVEDYSEVTLASGAQGGYHVWTAPRLRGAAGTLYLDREARRVSDGLLMLRASRLVFEVPTDAMSDWWHEPQAIPSFMCPAPVGIQAFDTEVEFRFELRNEDEELLATDTLIVVPRCETGTDGEHCRNVCSG